MTGAETTSVRTEATARSAAAGIPGDIPFPTGFLWGAATASHQVEGDNRFNDWWEFEQSGRLPHASGEACRHYQCFESDFDIARSLGHNAHRLSVEWSRVEPQQGVWNDSEVEHYAAVLGALRARGIEPIVTLHHFTNPAWFTRRGGWTRHDSVALFSRYVERVAARLAGRVRFWLTVNEPTVYVKHGYITGDWPPFLASSPLQAARAMYHLCRAHAAAYRVLHAIDRNAMVGLAHSAPYVVACDPASPADRAAARLRDFALNRLVFRLLGTSPAAVLDFIGINYYARQIVRARGGRGLGRLFGAECKDDHHGTHRAFTTLGWEIHAPGLREVLRQFSRYGVPLMVTENGIATTDEALREQYLSTHLRALGQAVEDGIPVLGYLYWTLMDNFEWTEGRTARFGLVDVDFATQKRVLRRTAELFAEVCQANAIGRNGPGASSQGM
jgi:beta-glucosidase